MERRGLFLCVAFSCVACVLSSSLRFDAEHTVLYPQHILTKQRPLTEIRRDADDASHADEGASQSQARMRRVTPAGMRASHSTLNDLYNRVLIDTVGSDGSSLFALSTKLNDAKKVTASNVYRSTDFGATFQYENALKGSLIDYFYSSQVHNNKVVFTDQSANMLWITVDDGDHYSGYHVDFTPSNLVFSPTEPDLLYAVDATTNAVYVSNDVGASWSNSLGDSEGDHVVLHAYWADTAGGDTAGDTLYMEVRDNTDPTYSRIIRVDDIVRKLGGGNIASVALVPGILSTGFASPPTPLAGSFFLRGRYMFFSELDTNTQQKALYVNRDRHSFQRALFGINTREEDHLVVDVTDNEVIVAVRHRSNLSNIFISEHRGLVFSLALSDVVFMSPPNAAPFVDLHRVKALRGVYIATQLVTDDDARHFQTMISFDRGAAWERVQPPEENADCLLPDCALNLHMELSHRAAAMRFSPVYSSPSAPGFILASGNLGARLNNAPDMYFSENAGIDWVQVRVGNMQYLMIDHGGVIVTAEGYQPYSDGTDAI